MKIGGDDKNSLSSNLLDASGSFSRLLFGRQAMNGADGEGLPLGQSFDPTLSQLGCSLVEDPLVRRNIQYQFCSIVLRKHFQSEPGAIVGFARQDYDDVGPVWLVDHQPSCCPPHHQPGENQNDEDPAATNYRPNFGSIHQAQASANMQILGRSGNTGLQIPSHLLLAAAPSVGRVMGINRLERLIWQRNCISREGIRPGALQFAVLGWLL
jgi:hypothetical protein